MKNDDNNFEKFELKVLFYREGKKYYFNCYKKILVQKMGNGYVLVYLKYDLICGKICLVFIC